MHYDTRSIIFFMVLDFQEILGYIVLYILFRFSLVTWEDKLHQITNPCRFCKSYFVVSKSKYRCKVDILLLDCWIATPFGLTAAEERVTNSSLSQPLGQRRYSRHHLMLHIRERLRCGQRA